MIIFILFLLLIACMLTVMYSALIVASDYDDLVMSQKEYSLTFCHSRGINMRKTDILSLTPEEKDKLTPGERLCLLRHCEGLTQEQLAELIPTRVKGPNRQTSAVTICNIEKGATLTESMAKKIIRAFPEKHYRLSWLLGYDNEGMTEEERERKNFERILAAEIHDAETHGTKYSAFIDLMKLQGVRFINGGPFSASQPLPAVTVYNGAEFNAAELERIIDKLFDMLKIELTYAAKEKEGDLSIEELENEKSNKDIDCAEPADDNVHADNGL